MERPEAALAPLAPALSVRIREGSRQRVPGQVPPVELAEARAKMATRPNYSS